MGDLDDCCCRRRRQKGLLELDLLEEKLIRFKGRELVLALHAEELVGRDGLAWVRDEALDQL